MEDLTKEEKKVFDQFDRENYRKGFLGELAVEKAIEKLGLTFKSNPKSSREDYIRKQARGPDHLTRGGLRIEMKNWKGFSISPSMYKSDIRPRFFKIDSKCIVIISDPHLTSGTEDLLMQDNIFVISIGEQIKLKNFRKCVRIITRKLKKFISERSPQILHSTLFTLPRNVLEKIISQRSENTDVYKIGTLVLEYEEEKEDSEESSRRSYIQKTDESMFRMAMESQRIDLR